MYLVVSITIERVQAGLRVLDVVGELDNGLGERLYLVFRESEERSLCVIQMD
jgi:hypothetical protein